MTGGCFPAPIWKVSALEGLLGIFMEVFWSINAIAWLLAIAVEVIWHIRISQQQFRFQKGTRYGLGVQGRRELHQRLADMEHG